MELLAHTMDRRREAKSVGQAYQRICSELGGEIEVLTRARFEDLKRVGGEDLAAAVTKVRAGEVEIVAGFDGRYGSVYPVR
jgi:PHP family Zn ribbon phosphoesterase